MNRDTVDSVLRSLRRVNIQGSFLGQTVAIRFGLSESDIETLEELMDIGSTTAGRLAEVTGLTSGAITRVIDRLEQAGYVRRVTDATDRRRVIVEVVPERIASIQQTLDRVSTKGAEEIGHYTDAQLALITDFLTKMEDITREETATLREKPAAEAAETSEHVAPIGGLREARLSIRSGLSALRLRPGADPTELYRAAFQGATPQVRLRDGRVLVQFKGSRWDWRGRDATIGLNTTIPWSVEVVGGLKRLEADLRAVDVRALDVTGGAERVQLELGQPTGTAPIRIVGGVKTVRVERPSGVGVRLQVTGGTGGVTMDGMHLDRSGGTSTVASPGWERERDRYDLFVIGGSKTIEVVGRP
jgi:DNA-binding MarR family transcriptional regulator